MTTSEHDGPMTGRSVTGPAEPTQAEIRAGKETEAALDPPDLVRRIESGGADYWVNRLMPDDDPEERAVQMTALDGDDEAELRRAELENERADIDLGRQRLALDERRLDQERRAAENELRIAALATARALVGAERYESPVGAAKELGVIHRAVLRMLVEPLPAPKPPE